MTADDYAKAIEDALTKHVLFGPLGCTFNESEWYGVVLPAALRALLEERKAMQQGISAVAMRLAQDSSYRHRASEDLLRLLPGLTTTADNQPETGKV